MSEPDMCHSFQPNTGFIVKLSAILERARPRRHRIIKCVIDGVGGEDDRDTCHIWMMSQLMDRSFVWKLIKEQF